MLRVSCPACQARYLSASNRGTGDNGQHLLSEPNYLLSTQEEGASGPVGPWSHTPLQVSPVQQGRPRDLTNLMTYGDLLVRNGEWPFPENAVSLFLGLFFFFFFLFCPTAHDRYDGPGAPGFPGETFYRGVGGANPLGLNIWNAKWN